MIRAILLSLIVTILYTTVACAGDPDLIGKWKVVRQKPNPVEYYNLMNKALGVSESDGQVTHLPYQEQIVTISFDTIEVVSKGPESVNRWVFGYRLDGKRVVVLDDDGNEIPDEVPADAGPVIGMIVKMVPKYFNYKFSQYNLLVKSGPMESLGGQSLFYLLTRLPDWG